MNKITVCKHGKVKQYLKGDYTKIEVIKKGKRYYKVIPLVISDLKNNPRIEILQ